MKYSCENVQDKNRISKNYRFQNVYLCIPLAEPHLECFTCKGLAREVTYCTIDSASVEARR